MAQHDYVIDNSTGANVRADINSVLQAIASNNSGSSDPSTTYAFQLFADTTNNVMKIRNAANNGFIELFQLDGTFTLEDGSASTPALAFRDDLNTGIFSGGADEFNIATGGTERFVINSSGNCGIGTTSVPTGFKVAVNGDLSLGETGGSDNTFIDQKQNGQFEIINSGRDDNAGGIRINRMNNISGDTTYFRDVNIYNGKGTSVVYVDGSAASVGVGTTSPAAKLHISDVYHFTAAGGNSTTGMQIGNYDGSSYGVLSLRASTHRFDISGSEKMRIDSSGRVMISTTAVGRSGAQNLTIGSGSGDQGMTIRSGSSDEGNIYFSDGSSGGTEESRGIIRFDHADDSLKFFTASSSNFSSQRMSIDSSGRVLIGLLANAANASIDDLQVGNPNSSNQSGITIGSNDEAAIAFANNGDARAGSITYNMNDDAMIFKTDGQNERMRLNNSGTVLIGTTSSSNSDNGLEVRNSNSGGALGVTSSNSSSQQDFILFKVGSGNTANGGIRRDGTTNGIELFSGSDRRIKTNIENMDNVLEKINKLSLKKFDFKQGGSGVGVIAQDLISIFPNKVKKDDSDDGTGDTVPDGVEAWTVGHNFTYELLKAVQELTARVEALEAA